MIRNLNVRGTTLAVHDSGSGHALIFVHGFPFDHSMWKHQIEEFAARWRVVAPDLRGFGASEPPECVVRMEDFADDMAAVLDALGIADPVVFVGLSMGGYIGWQFARRHAARLRALVAVDTRAIADTAEGAANREKVARQVMKDGAGVVAEPMLEKVLGKTTRAGNPALVASVDAMMRGASPKGIAAAARGMAQRPEVTVWLGEISAPTLVLVGAEDSIASPEEMEGISKRIPNSTFAVVPEAGHLCPLENPSATNRELRAFLDTLS